MNEELVLTGEELRKLEKAVDKIEEPTLYKKIHKKRSRGQNVKVRILRKIAANARREREDAERLLDGIVQIPDWLFTESKADPTSIEAVTIDMVRMLRGDDRKKLLQAFHEWKDRQKDTDRIIAKRVEQRINRQKAIKKDPEAFYARQKHYHEVEKARKHLQRVLWLQEHPKKPKKVLNAEEILEKKRIIARKNYKRNREKILAQRKKKYAERHHDKDTRQ